MSNHDRAACLLCDGEIICAISEERLDRRKKSEGFYGEEDKGIILPPMAAINYVLQAANINLTQIDWIIVGCSISSCRESAIRYLPVPAERIIEPPIPYHHLTHAYSVFGTMPFEKSAILVLDEQGHHLDNGKFEKCTWFRVMDGKIELIRHFYGMHCDISLGMFYDIFASLLGLSEAGMPSAGKLMGLAAYGVKQDWPPLIELSPDGNFHIFLHKIDAFLKSINFPVKPGMENLELTHIDELLIKYEILWRETALAKNIAYFTQSELERTLLHTSRALRKLTGEHKLSLAGGVALNCIANSKLTSIGWKDVYIHPAATDDGTAIGLAYYGWHRLNSKPIKVRSTLFFPFTGRNYSDKEVEGSGIPSFFIGS